MKRLVFLLPILLVLLFGCGKDEENTKVDKDIKQDDLINSMHQGVVIDKKDVANYSYLEIKEDNKKYWIAVPTMNINKGEKVIFSQYMEMKDFRSDALNKTFESVLFVNDAKKYQTGMDMPKSHPNVNSQKKADLKVNPVSGGKTIAQIYLEKANLNGKSVKVSGKVVKYNPGIMNRNWIHIQDGTGDENSFDLLVTSNDAAIVGDVIVAEGILALDKDFGAGYVYKVLLENAKIVKQNQL